MLDIETKRRIDSARDILVGKVPDPKSQVEQITIALIYKFMDDMDMESEELGGERSFFKGEFEKYAWRKIFDPRMGGFEILNMYSEAIMKMNVNPNIPQLFRDIFKNAYLPYRDPETLKAFLKIIHEFTYDHSEKLGDAFEYLLSVLGSQGDAGQFRTPRHIIDFMVAIVDPKKDEVIMDPACGTAGFLISSYKHIVKNNSANYDPKTDVRTFETKGQNISELIINSKNYKGDKLTPDERSRLAKNIKGYDISPDMVRLSLVNMYLHGLHAPKISEYDTLTSEDNWNEYGDVILANPPFMSPKGGIRPHKRFSVTSNRSEVLFVDYIAEHLTPNGRAAVIVPEGIIFQSGKAYKILRKMLVEEYLVGVLSLPAGVFQPYSGVKTSILWLDKALAKKTDSILFIKVENDGFDLGAQRRPIKQNDLPKFFKSILEYKKALMLDKSIDLDNDPNLNIVTKNEIGSNVDCNLSGERYAKSNQFELTKVQIVKLDEVADIEYGFTDKAKDEGEVRFIRITDINQYGLLKSDEPKYIDLSDEAKKYLLKENDILVARTGATYGKTLLYQGKEPGVFASFLIRINIDTSKILPFYYWVFTHSDIYWNQAKSLVTGGGQPQFNGNALKQIQIPLPPLSMQEKIVAEIESYQKIIDGARQVVENYKPRIDIDPEWEMVELGEVCDKITDGSHFSPETSDEGYPYITVKDLAAGVIDFDNCKRISEKEYNELVKNGCKPLLNDVLFSKDGTVGKTALIDFERDFVVLSSLAIIRPDSNIIDSEYLYNILSTDYFINAATERKTGVAIRRIVLKTIKTIPIPVPALNLQKEVNNRIRKEKVLIQANYSIISLYEQKIKERIAKVWREKQ